MILPAVCCPWLACGTCRTLWCDVCREASNGGASADLPLKVQLNTLLDPPSQTEKINFLRKNNDKQPITGPMGASQRVAVLEVSQFTSGGRTRRVALLVKSGKEWWGCLRLCGNGNGTVTTKPGAWSAAVCNCW